MSPEHCRAARAWIGWSQTDLAKAAKVGLSTVRDFERAGRAPNRHILAALRECLELQGFKFEFGADGLEPVGLKFAKPKA